MPLTRQQALWWMVPLTVATLIAFMAAVFITFLPRPQQALAAPDPLACTGYPEPRTFLEVQSWWTEPGIAEPMHLHAGTCFPLGANMTGTSTFDVRVMLHRNPGKLIALSFDFYSGYEQYLNVPDVTCGIANDCTYWYSVTVNWNDVPAGWRELRIKPRVRFPNCGPSPCDEDAGATQITSSGWPVQVRGGTSGTRSSCQNNKTTCFTESRGWYEHRGYQNVHVNNLNLLIGAGNTWSGNKVVPIKINCGCGGEDTPTTHWRAVLDPDFHNGNPGILVASGTGSFNGNITVSTATLADGPHKLVLIGGSDQPNHAVPGILEGVGVYPFTAEN